MIRVKLTRKVKYIIIFAIIAGLISGLAFAFQPVKVRTGSKLLCRYGHVIKDNTKLIKVPRWKAGRYKVEIAKATCDKHKVCEKLYKQALKALDKGDLEAGRRLLEQVRSLDPKFKDTQKRLEKVEKAIAAETGEAPAPGTEPSAEPSTQPGAEPAPSPPGAPPPSEGEVFTGPLLSLIPKTLEGYTLYSEHEDVLSANRVFKPKTESKVKFLTIMVRQGGRPKDAEALMEKEIKWYYPVDSRRDVTVDGRSCYFGTDGRQFAVLTWRRDGLIFAVEIYSSTHPKKVYDDIVAISKKI